MTAATRTAKILALAASAALIGSPAEAATAFLMAGQVAAREGLDIWAVCDALGLDASKTVAWTCEPAPRAVTLRGLAVITLADGSMLQPYECDEGVMIERWVALPDGDFRMTGRGFWRDCDLQEAAYLALDAWELL